MTHTPGHWRVTPEVETDRGRMWGINAYENTSGITGDARLAEVYSIEANARLMAAAPEMLEACKAIFRVADTAFLPGPVHLSQAEVNALRDAIAKAEEAKP